MSVTGNEMMKKFIYECASAIEKYQVIVNKKYADNLEAQMLLHDLKDAQGSLEYCAAYGYSPEIIEHAYQYVLSLRKQIDRYDRAHELQKEQIWHLTRLNEMMPSFNAIKRHPPEAVETKRTPPAPGRR